MNRYMIEEEEVQRFGHLWRNRCAEMSARPGIDGDVAMPHTWVIAQILSLSDECVDRPVAELAPMIRRILDESWYACDAGDIVCDGASTRPTERQVELLVATVEDWRRVPA